MTSAVAVLRFTGVLSGKMVTKGAKAATVSARIPSHCSCPICSGSKAEALDGLSEPTEALLLRAACVATNQA